MDCLLSLTGLSFLGTGIALIFRLPELGFELFEIVTPGFSIFGNTVLLILTFGVGSGSAV